MEKGIFSTLWLHSHSSFMLVSSLAYRLPISRMMNYQQQMQSALRYHQQGQQVQAKKIYQALLLQVPDDPQASHFLGLLYQQLGDHSAALPLLRKAAKLLPQQAQAQSVLAVSLLETGEVDEAITYLHLAIEANPRSVAAHNSLGMALKEHGDLAAAIASYENAARLKPGVAQIHNNLGNALTESGNLQRAVASYRHAVKLQPVYPDALNNLGLALQKQGQFSEAGVHFKSAINQQPAFVDAHLNLVVTLALAGDANASKTECARLLEQQPDNAMGHNYMGNACNTLGEQSLALEHFRHAVELDPKLTEAHLQLALISKNTANIDEEALLRLFEDPGTDVGDRIELGFTLGRVYEARKEWGKSFSYYQQANRLKADSVHVSISETRVNFEQIKSIFNQELLNRHANLAPVGENAIFVLGMPRSGTSLVEQILASHSQVTGAGELKFLGEVARKMAADLEGQFPTSLEQLATEDIPEYSQSYLSLLAASGDKGQQIVDKMPQNFHYIGLVALILPNARIIHCRRHPLATCFSLFKTLFTSGQDYSYNLSDLGQYFGLYEDLMSHWDMLLEDRILHLDYEALVNNTESEIRRLLDFCDLKFEPGCMDFYKTKRAVSTASAAQVREPIYRDSVSQWKHYAPYLHPLEEALKLS